MPTLKPLHSQRAVLIAGFVTGLAVLALCMLEWRSVTVAERFSSEVLRLASRHTAAMLAEELQRAFKAPVHELLEQIDHLRVHKFDLIGIAESLQERPLPPFLPDLLFVGRRGARSAELHFLSMPRLATRVEMASNKPAAWTFFQNPELSRHLLAEVDELARLGRRFVLTQNTIHGRTHEVVYHFLVDAPPETGVTPFMGFAVDTERLKDEYLPRLLTQLWEAGELHTSVPGLVISVIDENDREVYRSGPSLLQHYEAEATLPFVLFDIDLIDLYVTVRPAIRYWSVRTSYATGSIESIVRRQTNHQRILSLLIGLGALSGLLLSAHAAIRQIRLAHMKSDFVASISHELKTPLTKIRLFADTLRAGRGRTLERVQTYSEIISAQAHRLDHLIAGILDIAKMESGVTPYTMREVDLVSVVRSALLAFDYELVREGFRVEAEFPNHDVVISGDAESLQQLIGNLISNAIKYSDREHFLRVTLDAAEICARIEVADRGMGIPKDEQLKIFRQFYRGKRASTVTTGAGLGLTIVQYVVRAHGGRLMVRSAPGEGSTFIIEFPLKASRGEV